MTNGFFITFEGGEGVGKTTQIAQLCERLRQKGQDVAQTREPGGTPHAEKIRGLLSDPELGHGWNPQAEIMLISAARAMHVDHLIRPSLKANKTVVCDRFTDSTWVYQGIVQKQPEAFIDILIEHATDDVAPDLTFILDLPAEEGLKRVRERGIRDHYDQQDETFYEQVRQGFLTIAGKYPERCVIINAMREPGEIADEIERITLERMDRV